MPISTRPLGSNGPAVGRIGYGAMVLEGYYGSSDDSQAIATIHRALDLGVTMIDSADAYGNGHNEELIGRAVKDRRSQAFIASKFGIVFDDQSDGSPLTTNWGFDLKINGKPDYARQALDASLKRLGTDYLDLWYAHFPDPTTPIEETVGAMAEAVQAGKVKRIGLSNVSAEQVRRAQAVHPISAVQYEYSLWRREAEIELLPTLRELGIALVAWSPLGSGFLTGQVKQVEDGDFRQNDPRYSGQNLSTNLDRFAVLGGMAEKLDMTPAQLALAWLLHRGDDVFPIPGTRKSSRVEENAHADGVQLSPEILAEIDRIAAHGSTAGATLL